MSTRIFGTPLAATVLALACLAGQGRAQTVDQLVARNVAARGGEEAWRAVTSLRLTGRMDVGQDLRVPYVLEQKRPDRMRLEFVFDDETTVQAYDGRTGWKIAPFRGRKTPEPMTDLEQLGVADYADLYGPLYDYAARGRVVELLGKESVEGRDAYQLKVTSPGGSVRWIYLDAETGLEMRMDALRTVAGRERRTETFYRDWQDHEGILIPHRQETRTEGQDALHALTVETVVVNPPLDDARFAMPAKGPAEPGPTARRQ